MNIITTTELQDRLDQGPVALFDVRGDIAYEQKHIPGAKTAPLGSLTFRVARIMKPQSFVAVYSQGAEDQLAQEAVDRLQNLGLKNVHCYSDGLDGWLAAGLSAIESPSPKSHTWGPVMDVRPLLVDRERSYGGAFSHKPVDSESAGG